MPEILPTAQQPGAVGRAMIGPCSPLYTTQQTTPDKVEIQLDSKMRSAAQKSCQNRVQIIQCMPGFTELAVG